MFLGHSQEEIEILKKKPTRSIMKLSGCLKKRKRKNWNDI